ncbi:MAG: non-canonical purine NTP pyrophosphatase, partial [Pyrinomonadaceae bacterium]|nr:non-canonical purine NTP pyrophosphatase [Pyrinomonadaceae bacterium]
REISAHTGLVTLADDSGLEVDALGGAPGVRSARYGGLHLNDSGRIRLLLTEMERFGSVTRQARFVCVLALAAPQTVHPRIFQGVCEGHIALSPRGRRGFGYDPVFIPDGHVLTFGQLPDEVKSRLSHRAQALAALRKFLSPVCPLDLILSTPAV